MAKTNETPVTFNLPDGQVQLITWDFVLAESEKRMASVFEKMAASNNRLDAIATRLEEWAQEGDDD